MAIDGNTESILLCNKVVENSVDIRVEIIDGLVLIPSPFWPVSFVTLKKKINT